MAKSSKKKPKLTPKRERFCHEYLIDLNASAAARRAGFNDASAGQRGHELVKNSEIQARIGELQAKTGAEFNITKQRLMTTLMNIIGADIKDITDPETGSIMPVHEWPEHMRGVVSGIESDELYAGALPIGFKRKVKFWDKNKSIELLNKMLGFNMPDKVAQTDPTGQNEVIPVIKIYPVKPKEEDD